MLKCPQCGNTQEENGNCPQCAVPLVETESEAAASEQPQANEANVQIPQGQPEVIACITCGADLPPGGAFCSICGTKVGEPAVAAQPPAQAQPPQAAYPNPAPEPAPVQQDTGEAKKGSSKKTLGIAISLAAIFLICIGVFVYYQTGGDIDIGLPVIGGTSEGGSGSKIQAGDRPFVYLQDKEVLKFRTSEMEKSETITDSFSMKSDYSEWMFSDYLSYISEDGSYLLYLNNFRQTDYYSFEGRGDLYIRDLTTSSSDIDIGIKIASDVTSDFYISDDNSYVFYINNKNDLYVWDFSEVYKLDSNVTGIYSWTADRVFYYKGDVDDYYTSYFTSRDCYVAPLTQDGRDKREKIDTDVSDMLDWNEELTEFIYTKNTSSRSSDTVTFDLFHYDLENDLRETLESDISDVVNAELETGRIVFLKEQEATVFYEDIIEDDMLEEDALLLEEPSMSDYPLLDWYYNDYSYYSDDEVDYDQLEEEYAAYEEAVANYEAKEKRDRIREQLNSELDSASTIDLYLYDMYLIENGEKSKIDGDVYTSSSYTTQPRANLQNGLVSYTKADLQDLPKLKLSEMQTSYYAYSFDLEDYIASNLTGELYVCILGGTPKRLIDKDDSLRPNTRRVVLSDDGTSLYYQATDTSAEEAEEEESSNSSSSSYGSWYDDWYDDYWYDYGYDYDDWYGSSYSSDKEADPVNNLYYAPVNGTTIGDSKLVDSDIDYLEVYWAFMGQNLYMTKGKNYLGDLYSISGENRERIAFDVSTYYEPEVYNDGATLIFFEDYDTNRDMGDLYIIKADGEKEKISDSVYEFYYRADDAIYLLCNYRAGKGDLYLYDGNDTKLIDYDVSAVVEPWYAYNY